MEDIMYLYHICREKDKGDTTEGYIGITNNPHVRWGSHRNMEGNAHLCNALKKYADIVYYVICKTNKEFALYLEERIRPIINMGWNIAKGGGIPPSFLGRKHTEETLNKMSMSQSGVNNHNFGKARSEKSKAKMKATMLILGYPLTGKFGKDNPSYGRKCTDKQKKLMSVNCKKRMYKQVTCNHCGVIGSSQAMGRWHFNNCRDKK